MKQKIFLFSVIILQLNFYAQQKKYATKTIGSFILEKFPIHYLVIPAKATKETDKKTGKLISYTEYNKFGQIDGLSVNMRFDGKYPHVAVYKYKGETIYTASYFPNTNIAEVISSSNTDGVNDGYKVLRTLKTSGGYTENVEKYEDGKLVEVNGIKETGPILTFKDSLLDGEFKYEFGTKKFEGEAVGGNLKRIRQYSGKTIRYEIVFKEDSFIMREPSESTVGKFYDKSYKLINKPIITNSKTNCYTTGNFNGYPYLIITGTFDLINFPTILEKNFTMALLTKQTFIDSLLDGDFQYREYIYPANNGFFHSEYVDVFGKTLNGKLLNLKCIKYYTDSYSNEIKSKTEINYNFTKTNVEITETDNLKNKVLSTYTVNIENHVVLTNSKIKGGYFKYDINDSNIDKALHIPIVRNAILTGNTVGFYYFNPLFFNSTKFIDYIKKMPSK